jgi:hypothetical protein
MQQPFACTRDRRRARGDGAGDLAQTFDIEVPAAAPAATITTGSKTRSRTACAVARTGYGARYSPSTNLTCSAFSIAYGLTHGTCMEAQASGILIDFLLCGLETS